MDLAGKDQPMEMQQIRYFLAVARTLNFTRAAEECNVSQPALTRAIKLLEDELGGELIRREGRHSHLTDLGARMQPILRQCHESAQSARALASSVKRGEIAPVAIAVSRAIDPALIMGLLREMIRAFPGFQLRLRRGGAAAILQMLKSGEVDLAIGGPLGESWDRLDSWPMFRESFDLIVGVDHELARHNDPDLIVDLVHDMALLLHSGADPTEAEMIRLAEAGLDVGKAHEVDSDRDLEALISAKVGVGLAPSSALQNPQFRHLPFAGLDLTRTVAVYTIAGRARSREASALLALLRGADWSGAAASGQPTGGVEDVG
jgi:DNA-binding transcriptional LysR family regulator